MKRIALTVLGAGSPLILLAFLVGGTAGQWLFVFVSLGFPVAISAFGVRAGERNGALVRVLVGLALLLELSALGVLLVTPRMAAGLPRSTWLMLLGLALAPLVLVSFGFAATFRPPRPPAGS